MGEKINGLGNGGIHVNKWAAFKLSFSYPGLLSHKLSIPSRNISAKLYIKETDLRDNLSAIKRLVKDAPPVQLQKSYDNDKLYFNVAMTEEQRLELELTHVDHFCRWNLHARPIGTFTIINREMIEAKLKLKVEFKFKDADWTEIDLGAPFSLLEYAAQTEKGMNFGIRVKGGTSEQRQKTLLDLLLAFRCEEERDIAIEREANAKKHLTRFVATEDFQNIPKQADAKVTIKNCAIPNSMIKGEKIGVPGQVVIWRFYRDFAAVKKQFPGESRDKVTLESHFREIHEVIEKMIENPQIADKQDWEKYLDLFKDLEGKILARANSDGMISIELIEKTLIEQRDRALKVVSEKYAVDIETFINYLAKSLLKKELQNKLPITDKPVILLAPVITPAEAKSLPKNVIMVLAPDMPQNAHAGMLITQNGIKYYRPNGEVSEFIRTADPDSYNGQWAAVIMAENNLWLNIGVPANLYQYLISLQRIEEAEQIRDLALNILQRKIHGGRTISVKAMVNDLDIAKASFKKYMPDGIALVRTEMIEKEKQLSAGELGDVIIGLCDAATVEVDNMENPLPVTVRLLDVGARRDDKDPVWISKENKLKGAAFLLSAEGKEILRSQLRACLLAHLERRNQVRVMIPYIESLDQFNEIKDILQEVKKEMISEFAAQAKVAPTYKYAGITLDSLGIWLGVMIENAEATAECAALTREAHFCSLGLNDLRNSFKKETIVEPELVGIISKVIEAAKKTSTPVSVCGEIMNDNELIMLMALGIGEIGIDFGAIPKFSGIIRSLDQKELEKIKGELLKAKSQEEIKGIIDAGRRHLGEWQAHEASSMAEKGYNQKYQDEQIRFAKIHTLRIQAYSNIMQIIRSNQEEKVEKIHDVLQEIFKDEHKRYVEFPSKEDISNWLNKEMLIITFLDEWEIREALNKKCRCTPYIFYHSKDEDTYWARAIPRGGVTGSMSRYYIKYLGQEYSKEGSSLKTRRHLVQVNYFNVQEKATKQATCVLEHDPEQKEPNYFRVTVPIGNKQEEILHLYARKEGGEREFYRRISAEKLFIAKVFDNSAEIPPHSAVYKTPADQGMIPALFIQDRSTLSEIKSLKDQIEGLEDSIKRDSQSVYYQPKDPTKNDPFNVNQILFFRMRDVQENMSYVIAVDNWMENMKGFQPLLDDPTRLTGIVKFLGVETKVDEMLVNHIKEIRQKDKEIVILKKENDGKAKTINVQELQLKELKVQLEEKNKRPSPE